MDTSKLKTNKSKAQFFAFVFPTNETNFQLNDQTTTKWNSAHINNLNNDLNEYVIFQLNIPEK